MSEAVVRLENVSKVYGSNGTTTTALSEVSFEVESSSWTAIVGPSGHGKSTLLQLMGGLDRPSEGAIYLDGENLAALSPRGLAGVRARKIGFVFQFFNLLPHLTALENIQTALWFGGRTGAAARSRSLDLLDRVGLGSRAHHLPGMLSGGEQQRVAVARAMANEPDLLLLDEPTGNLDTAGEEDLLGLLDELHRQGRALVMVTHNPAVARRAERILRMKDGRIESDEQIVPGHLKELD